MANQWDEMMDEKDFDEDIKKRESLIEEAKNLDASLSWNELSRKITELKRRWKRISYWESAYEVKMAEEFDAVLDVFYAKRNEIYQNSQVLKQELISKAKELSESTNFNKATDEMKPEMQEKKRMLCGKALIQLVKLSLIASVNLYRKDKINLRMLIK